jgi:hypothetical protein
MRCAQEGNRAHGRMGQCMRSGKGAVAASEEKHNAIQAGAKAAEMHRDTLMGCGCARTRARACKSGACAYLRALVNARTHSSAAAALRSRLSSSRTAFARARSCAARQCGCPWSCRSCSCNSTAPARPALALCALDAEMTDAEALMRLPDERPYLPLLPRSLPLLVVMPLLPAPREPPRPLVLPLAAFAAPPPPSPSPCRGLVLNPPTVLGRCIPPISSVPPACVCPPPAPRSAPAASLSRGDPRASRARIDPGETAPSPPAAESANRACAAASSRRSDATSSCSLSASVRVSGSTPWLPLPCPPWLVVPCAP